MYAPYPENMLESIKKVEATRAQRIGNRAKTSDSRRKRRSSERIPSRL